MYPGKRANFMAISVRNEGAKVNSNINVTPMVDVMLVLLIIFMVITPMLHKGVDVEMAKVDNPTAMQDADKDDALIVAIQRSGDVFFGSDKAAGAADAEDQRQAGQPHHEQDGVFASRCARKI